jgi:hypothetical protein
VYAKRSTKTRAKILPVGVPSRVTKRSKARPVAARVIGAVAKGETASCIGYHSPNHHPLDERVSVVDHVLHEIDVLVKAELPAAQCNRYERPDGERVWVWSLGEPEGVAFWPRQKPEEGVAYFPQGELGGDAYWVPSRS